MKWSVIVTVHEYRPVLKDCLRSIHTQYPDNDMEVVVCDQSGAYDCKRAARDFRYVQHQRAGLAQAWNAAVAEAKVTDDPHHWVHLIHDDDWVMPGFYKALTSNLIPGASGHNNNYIASTGFKNVRDGKVTLQSEERSGIVPNWRELIAVGNSLQVAAVVFRKNLFDELGGFRERGWCTDWDLWARMAMVAQWWHEPMRLARYREHPESAQEKMKVGDKVRSYCSVFRDNVERLPRQWGPLIEASVNLHTNRFMAAAVNVALGGNCLEAPEVFDEVVGMAADALRWQGTGQGVSVAP